MFNHVTHVKQGNKRAISISEMKLEIKYLNENGNDGIEAKGKIADIWNLGK